MFSPPSDASTNMPSQFEALQNAQLLKQSPSRANMANYASIFDGPEEGHVPTAWESYSAGQNADSAETALGAGPAIDALRAAMDENRLQSRADVQADLSDDQLVEDDFNANGRNRAVAHANVGNEVGDLNSEAKARRGFLPWGQAQNERDTEQAFGLADTRYGQPARIRGQADIASAQIGAQGRMGAAQMRQGNPMEALYKALDEYQAKQGRAATPEEVDGFKRVYGVQ